MPGGFQNISKILKFAISFAVTPLFYVTLAFYEPQTTADCFRNLYSLRIVSSPRGKAELQHV